MAKPVAVITGAGRRLGLHMTQVLLTQGWHVLALSRGISGDLEELASLHPQLTIIPCDALDDASVSQAIDTIKANTKHLDFILHNASIYEKDAAHFSDECAFYDALYQIHMKLPARLNRALSDLLFESQRPTANIIHVTDIFASNPNPEYALYCSTKAGLENLMISFAKRLAPRVRVNAIQPGPIKFLPEHSAGDKQQVLSETLLPVEGGFEALQQAIESILNNEYMTAASIRVDGGRSVT